MAFLTLTSVAVGADRAPAIRLAAAIASAS